MKLLKIQSLVEKSLEGVMQFASAKSLFKLSGVKLLNWNE